MHSVCIFGGIGDDKREDVSLILKKDIEEIIKKYDSVLFFISGFGYLGEDAIRILKLYKEEYNNFDSYVVDFLYDDIILYPIEEYKHNNIALGLYKLDILKNLLIKICSYSDISLCVVDTISIACEKEVLDFLKNENFLFKNYFDVYKNNFDENATFLNKRLI